MSTTPEWHAKAKELQAKGLTCSAIAHKLHKARSTVAWALDEGNTKQKHRERVRLQRKSLSANGSRMRVMRRPVVEASAPIVIRHKPSLPQISISPVEEMPRVIRFAPKVRVRASSGADRWREIHRAMIRAGRLPEPGLPEQFYS